MERNVRTDLEACCEADLRFHTSFITGSKSQRGLKGLTGTIEAALRVTFNMTNCSTTAQCHALWRRTGRFSSASACATPTERGPPPSISSASPSMIST